MRLVPILVGLLSVMFADQAARQDDAMILRGESGTWFVSIDNDAFNGSDDHYSSGVQLGWASGYFRDYAAGPVPSILVTPLRSLPRVNAERRRRFVSYSLSHRIFTPNDISNSALIRNDMPYSGLLLSSFTAGAQDAKSMDAFGLVVGIVGPAAMGERIQKAVHRAVDSTRPRGWAHQLRNEPLLNFDYQHHRRLVVFGSQRGWGGDLTGQAAIAAGNLLTSGTLGLSGRWGWRVPDDFGPAPQLFADEAIGSRPFSAAAGERGAWLFVLVNASAFVNAILWDGNTFRDSHSIDYDPWIARVHLGVRVRLGRWGASFALVTTTVPWTNPENRSRQHYGRLGLTFSY